MGVVIDGGAILKKGRQLREARDRLSDAKRRLEAAEEELTEAIIFRDQCKREKEEAETAVLALCNTQK